MNVAIADEIEVETEDATHALHKVVRYENQPVKKKSVVNQKVARKAVINVMVTLKG